MLNHDPFASQRTTALFLFFGQRMMFRFLTKGLAVFMKFCQALVTSICQYPNVLCNGEFLDLEKLEVMLATLAKDGRHNFSGFPVGNQLRFLSMLSLFAHIVLFLAFLEALPVVHWHPPGSLKQKE